jgi:hypothetical protein
MQQDQPDAQEMLGSQGNEGMYGQGQYDSEGKPDPHGAEAQRLKPDPTVNEKPSTQGNQEAAQGNQQQNQQPSQPISPKQ